MSMDDSEITGLLHAWSDGDAAALDQLIPVVFKELRDIARKSFSGESPNHTLQPTHLVGVVWERLIGLRKTKWETRKQFFSFASLLMRRLLVDHANRKNRLKRHGQVQLVPLTAVQGHAAPTGLDPALLVTIGEVLNRLEQMDPALVVVVDMKFFGGMTSDEIAEVLGCSRATVTRQLTAARMFLARELGADIERSLPPDD